MKLILTSSIDLYSKNERGERIAHNFGNENGLLDLLKELTPKQENFVFVASTETNYDATDIMQILHLNILYVLPVYIKV